MDNVSDAIENLEALATPRGLQPASEDVEQHLLEALERSLQREEQRANQREEQREQRANLQRALREVDGQFSHSWTSEIWGSGVLFEENGQYYVITNEHVVRRHLVGQAAGSIAVALNGLSDDLECTERVDLLGADAMTDVAVLRFPRDHLPCGREGVSFFDLSVEHTPRIGDSVFAIGAARDFANTISSGIVSAIDRFTPPGGWATFSRLVQTDADIHSGNSGGALIDHHGNLVGINTFAAGGDLRGGAVNFAVDGRTVAHVAAQLIENGEVQRVGLPIRVADCRAGWARSSAMTSGLIVTDCLGVEVIQTEDDVFQRGDRLIDVNGRSVRDYSEFLVETAMIERGSEKVEVNYCRPMEDETGENCSVVNLETTGEIVLDGGHIDRRLQGLHLQNLREGYDDEEACAEKRRVYEGFPCGVKVVDRTEDRLLNVEREVSDLTNEIVRVCEEQQPPEYCGSYGSRLRKLNLDFAMHQLRGELKIGDVILYFNDRFVFNASSLRSHFRDLQDRLDRLEVGQDLGEMRVEVRRGADVHKISWWP